MDPLTDLLLGILFAGSALGSFWFPIHGWITKRKKLREQTKKEKAQVR